MRTILNDYIVRGRDQSIIDFKKRDDGPTQQYFEQTHPPGHVDHLEMLVNQWPWDKMFYPQGCETFIDLCLKQEGITNRGFWDFNGIGTPGKWVTVCCHPSAKGHDLFAKELFEHITNG